MNGLLLVSHLDPGRALLLVHLLPHSSSNAGDVTMIVLDGRRDFLLCDEIASEEDERVARPGDVSWWLPFCMGLFLGLADKQGLGAARCRDVGLGGSTTNDEWRQRRRRGLYG